MSSQHWQPAEAAFHLNPSHAAAVVPVCAYLAGLNCWARLRNASRLLGMPVCVGMLFVYCESKEPEAMC